MSHTVELIAVGTELLLGNIANTDGQFLSQELSNLGLNVHYHSVVGDNPARLAQVVEHAKTRADIIITTGGLGPTYDDLTKTVLAGCFGKKLVMDEHSAARIRKFFDKVGRVMTENNLQQAMLPEGCVVLHNDWGTGVEGEPVPENPHYGLHRFKQGFDAQLVEYAGQMDLELCPVWYRVIRFAQKYIR